MRREDEIRVADAFCRNWSRQRLVEEIVNERPDVVGLNCSTHTFIDAAAVLQQVHEKLPGARIVMGGFHATLATEKILQQYPFVDFIVRGEGERSFVMLLDCIERGVMPRGVPGISFLDGGEHVTTEPELIEDLDTLPFPDRGLLDGLDYSYVFHGIPLTFGKFTTMCTSRGCAYDCTYCSCAAFSRRRWRYRSAENVADEMELLYNQGYRSAVLIDDNFTQRPDRVERICELINERKIRMKLYCEGRVNHASVDLLRKMKAAGFDVIYFGAESASPHVLDYYRKRATPEQTLRALEYAKKSDMLVITSFILGAPVESPEDMRLTIDFIKKSRPHGVQINVLDILVGTPIWEAMCREGTIRPDDWKTNHRIYEYGKSSLDKEALEAMAIEGYNAYISSWKNAGGLAEFIKLLRRNSTARDIVLHNVLNVRAVMALIRGFNVPGGS